MKLDHIALKVKDVFNSAAFYKKWCGLEIVRRHDSTRGGQPVLHLQSPDSPDNTYIALSSGRQEAKTEKFEHLSFSVESLEQLRELVDKAKEAGVLEWDYTVGHEMMGTVFSVRDPDGNIVEFNYMPKRNQTDAGAKPQP